MRKWVLSVAVIVVSVGLSMWAGSAAMEKTMVRQVEREWPLGLGTIRDLPKRYPAAAATVAAQRLMVLTRELEKSPPAIRDAIRDYGVRQIQLANLTIDAPPTLVDAFLREHATDLDSIRALLISGSPVGWEQNVEMGAMAPVPKLAVNRKDDHGDTETRRTSPCDLRVSVPPWCFFYGGYARTKLAAIDRNIANP